MYTVSCRVVSRRDSAPGLLLLLIAAAEQGKVSKTVGTIPIFHSLPSFRVDELISLLILIVLN